MIKKAKFFDKKEKRQLRESKERIILARAKNYIRTYGSVEYSQLKDVIKGWLSDFFKENHYSLPAFVSRILIEENGFLLSRVFWRCKKCGSAFSHHPGTIKHGSQLQPIPNYHTYFNYRKEYIYKKIEIAQTTCKNLNLDTSQIVQIFWEESQTRIEKIKPTWWETENRIMKTKDESK